MVFEDSEVVRERGPEPFTKWHVNIATQTFFLSNSLIEMAVMAAKVFGHRSKDSDDKHD